MGREPCQVRSSRMKNRLLVQTWEQLRYPYSFLVIRTICVFLMGDIWWYKVISVCVSVQNRGSHPTLKPFACWGIRFCGDTHADVSKVLYTVAGFFHASWDRDQALTHGRAARPVLGAWFRHQVWKERRSNFLKVVVDLMGFQVGLCRLILMSLQGAKNIQELVWPGLVKFPFALYTSGKIVFLRKNMSKMERSPPAWTDWGSPAFPVTIGYVDGL